MKLVLSVLAHGYCGWKNLAIHAYKPHHRLSCDSYLQLMADFFTLKIPVTMHSAFPLPWAPPLAELTIDSLMDPLRRIRRRQTVGEIALTTFFMYSTTLPTSCAARLEQCACFNSRLRLRQLRAGMLPPSLYINPLFALGTFTVLVPDGMQSGEGAPNSH